MYNIKKEHLQEHILLESLQKKKIKRIIRTLKILVVIFQCINIYVPPTYLIEIFFQTHSVLKFITTNVEENFSTHS